MDGPVKLSLPGEVLRKARAIDLYLVAVWALAIVAVLAAAGSVLLAVLQSGESTQLAALGTTALVGLVAMLRGGEQA